MHERFGLVLMVNHACNLRCTYCYTGDKFRRRMSREIGQRAIDRALRSISFGGVLELGFFGGEPLIEAALILELIDYAVRQAAAANIDVMLSMTTNGTIDTAEAWQVMLHSEMQLAISHDGLPEIHDRHRVSVESEGTSARVLQTIERLHDQDKEFRAVMVVRPDNVTQLADGMEFLFNHGVRRFDPSLDLWTTWKLADLEKLKAAVRRCSDFWAERLPDCGVSWFDEKLARIARVFTTDTARCGFGHSEIAVAPSGTLYPCERLIGEDRPDNPMRLAGSVLDGEDFLNATAAAGKSAAECNECAINPICSTTCRCSNYIRTQDIGRPDGLLCVLDQTCYRETVRTMNVRMQPTI